MLDSGASSELLDPVSPKLDFEDGDIDDELDPAMKEELDRFVNIIRAINYQLFCLNGTYILTGEVDGSSPFSSSIQSKHGELDLINNWTEILESKITRLGLILSSPILHSKFF